MIFLALFAVIVPTIAVIYGIISTPVSIPSSMDLITGGQDADKFIDSLSDEEKAELLEILEY